MARENCCARPFLSPLRGRQAGGVVRSREETDSIGDDRHKAERHLDTKTNVEGHTGALPA